jgi:hypothetical protein
MERGEVERLDDLVECLNVSRLDVLLRGLWLLDVSHLLVAAPSDTTIAIGLMKPPRASPFDGPRG